MGVTVPPTLKEVMEKCRERGEFVFTKEQHDNLLRAIGKTPAEKTPVDASKMTAETFDGFDWDKDMEEALKID